MSAERRPRRRSASCSEAHERGTPASTMVRPPSLSTMYQLVLSSSTRWTPGAASAWSILGGPPQLDSDLEGLAERVRIANVDPSHVSGCGRARRRGRRLADQLRQLGGLARVDAPRLRQRLALQAGAAARDEALEERELARGERGVALASGGAQHGQVVVVADHVG